MKKLLTHLDAIMRGHFGVGWLDPGCSSSACCHFEPSLGSEGSNESEWTPPADFGGTAEGSDGAGQPISASSRATIKGSDEARWPDSTGSEVVVEGLDGAGQFASSIFGARPPPPAPWHATGRAPPTAKVGPHPQWVDPPIGWAT